MHLRKNTFVVLVWIALCAVLMAALAPSISHMLHLLAGRGDAGPACAMPEHRLMHLAAAREGIKPPAHAMDMDDCGYCSMQGHLPMLPTVAAAAPLLVELVRAAPPLFLIAPRPLPVWLHARSRAPPGFLR